MEVEHFRDLADYTQRSRGQHDFLLLGEEQKAQCNWDTVRHRLPPRVFVKTNGGWLAQGRQKVVTSIDPQALWQTWVEKEIPFAFPHQPMNASHGGDCIDGSHYCEHISKRDPFYSMSRRVTDDCVKWRVVESCLLRVVILDERCADLNKRQVQYWEKRGVITANPKQLSLRYKDALDLAPSNSGSVVWKDRCAIDYLVVHRTLLKNWSVSDFADAAAGGARLVVHSGGGKVSIDGVPWIPSVPFAPIWATVAYDRGAKYRLSRLLLAARAQGVQEERLQAYVEV